MVPCNLAQTQSFLTVLLVSIAGGQATRNDVADAGAQPRSFLEKSNIIRSIEERNLAQVIQMKCRRRRQVFRNEGPELLIDHKVGAFSPYILRDRVESSTKDALGSQ